MTPVPIHITYTCNSKDSHFSADGTGISGSQGFKAFYDILYPEQFWTVMEILVTCWLLQLIKMPAGYWAKE